MKHLLVISIASLCLAGCTTLDPEYFLAEKSAGYVGCSPEQMAVTDEGYGFLGMSRRWDVACGGQRYYCSSHTLADGISEVTSCAPAAVN